RPTIGTQIVRDAADHARSITTLIKINIQCLPLNKGDVSMEKRYSILIVAAILFTCPILLSSADQSNCQANQQEQDSTEIKVQVDLVVTDALVVQQRTGKVIDDLTENDFTLYEEGVKQQISHFSKDTLPLSIILLIDRAGCLDPFNDKVRRATLAALESLKPEDEVALMAFSQSSELIVDFSRKRDLIADAITNLPDHGHGNHCFNTAFYDAAQHMRNANNPNGRRVIIMITAVTKGPKCEPSDKIVLHELLESGSVVCGLIPSSILQRMENAVAHIPPIEVINGIPSPSILLGGLGALRPFNLNKLAEETGGEVVKTKVPELDVTFNNLVRRLRTRYSLGFVSSNPNFDGRYRKLKLAVSPNTKKRYGNIAVKTRHGYIATRRTS
ncbi:MAG: VWA domain-containing protein, partial [Acidobacteriota bacterium]